LMVTMRIKKMILAMVMVRGVNDINDNFICNIDGDDDGGDDNDEVVKKGISLPYNGLGRFLALRQ